MTTRQLRFLRVLRLQDFSDAVEQLDVALVGVLLNSGNKSPGHCTCGLRCNRCIGAVAVYLALSLPQCKYQEGVGIRCLVVFAA
jgi:hypothetical protein